MGSTPRITTAARVPWLGFWGVPMSNKCDMAAFRSVLASCSLEASPYCLAGPQFCTHAAG
jgi:hypothetical protein